MLVKFCSKSLILDIVQQPRQNLESFFIQIVDAARAAHVETSGAQTGDTAAFLKGDETGDELIGKLTDQRPDNTIAAVEETKEAPSDDQDDKVLDALVNTDEAPEVRATEASTEPSAPTDADSSVIDALLNKDEQKE